MIRSVMTYDCPTWEYVADTHTLKLQHLQNRVLHAIGTLHRCTLVRELHMVFEDSLHAAGKFPDQLKKEMLA
jgi:hypothetical protein